MGRKIDSLLNLESCNLTAKLGIYDSYVMASFDVTSLFTNIPVDETMDNLHVRLTFNLGTTNKIFYYI